VHVIGDRRCVVCGGERVHTLLFTPAQNPIPGSRLRKRRRWPLCRPCFRKIRWVELDDRGNVISEFGGSPMTPGKT